ncbi:hypothetical protein BGZ81_000059 [Podila clonocystis]|nr:hypothetical protein BGZ81_000059 [Podila clonocystis]
MKLSKATSLFVLCAVTLLATAPTGIVAQIPGLPKPKPGPDDPGDTTSTSPKPTTAPPPTSSSSRIVTTTSAIPPVVTATGATSRPVATSSAGRSTPSSALPSGPATTAPASCMSTSDCPQGQPNLSFCQLAVSGAPAGICGPPPSGNYYCKASTPQVCTATIDCKDPRYSKCANDPDVAGRMVCVGLGDPTLSPCTQEAPKSGGGSGNITQTLTYAGIGVGSVAAFAVVFALVRWQRRRQRSKMPENMFGEVDYGMTDRSSTKAEPYAFTGRAAAQGSENYEDNYYQGGGGGGGGYNKDQYYDDQNYGHDGYGNGGGYGHGGHGHNDGYYDNSGYDDYNQPAAPARAMSPRGGDYQMDHYGAEPSEMDYGGHGHGHGGQGGHGGGGYGRY